DEPPADGARRVEEGEILRGEAPGLHHRQRQRVPERQRRRRRGRRREIERTRLLLHRYVQLHVACLRDRGPRVARDRNDRHLPPPVLPLPPPRSARHRGPGRAALAGRETLTY